MRLAKLITMACLVVVSGTGLSHAQVVEPLRVLEQARRDRLETDRRLAREAAARQQKEKADQAAEATAQRKRDREVAPTATSDANNGTAVAQPSGPAPAAQEPPGAPIPTAPASIPAVAAFDQPGPPPAGEVVGAPAPHTSATDPANGAAPSDQPSASQQQGPAPAPIQIPPRVLITVDKAAQRMRVTVDGKLRHSWSVSTGRAQYETPAGTYRPLRLAKEHYSREWDDAPMPHSIFFTDRGHAIHGSNDIRRLGRRASHGCIRLSPSNAATLFALVRAEGPSATKVTIANGMSVKTARKAVRRRVEANARICRFRAGTVPL
jgi:lipoprotein-anchoring transpeptidase ErfK/SrfK